MQRREVPYRPIRQERVDIKYREQAGCGGAGQAPASPGHNNSANRTNGTLLLLTAAALAVSPAGSCTSLAGQRYRSLLGDVSGLRPEGLGTCTCGLPLRGDPVVPPAPVLRGADSGVPAREARPRLLFVASPRGDCSPPPPPPPKESLREPEAAARPASRTPHQVRRESTAGHRGPQEQQMWQGPTGAPAAGTGCHPSKQQAGQER